MSRFVTTRYFPYILTVILCLTGISAYLVYAYRTFPPSQPIEQHNLQTQNKRQLLNPRSLARQTFQVQESTILTGIAIKKNTYQSAPSTRLTVTVAENDQPIHTFEKAISEFETIPPFVDRSGAVSNSLFPPQWLYVKFLPTTFSSTAVYSITIKNVSASEQSLSLYYEHDSTKYPQGRLSVNNQEKAGDLAFILVGPKQPLRHIWDVASTAPHLSYILIIILGSVVIGIAWEAWQQIQKKALVIPSPPLLLFLLLSGIYTFPLYLDTEHWGREDWSEATAHYAAARQSLSHGQFPLWNPYFCGGSPLWGNPQAYWPSATFLFTFPFGDVLGTKLAISAYVFVGLLGMFLLARSLKIPHPVAITPALIYMLSGFFAVHISLGHILWLTIAWVPWVLYYFIKSFTKPAYLGLSVLFYLLILLEGQIYFFLYSFFLIAAIAILYSLRSPQHRSFALRSLALFLLLTFSLGAVKLLPTWVFVQHSEQLLQNTPPLPLSHLADLFLLSPRPTVSQPGDLTSSYESLAYIGWAPLLLAIIGVFMGLRKRKHMVFVFSSVAAIALIIIILPLRWNPLEALPIFDKLRTHIRLLLLVILSVSLLAGYGLMRAVSGWPPRTKEYVTLAVSLFIFMDLQFAAIHPLKSLFSVSPLTATPGQFQQSATRTDTAYHTTLANQGNPDYCPPHTRLWNPDAAVYPTKSSHYQGEVYSDHASQITIQSSSPNMIVLHIASVASDTDTVHLNQKFDRGWHSPTKNIVSHRGHLAFAITPADTSSQVVLSYRPRSVQVGLLISTLTAISLLGFIGKIRSSEPTQTSKDVSI